MPLPSCSYSGCPGPPDGHSATVKTHCSPLRSQRMRILLGKNSNGHSNKDGRISRQAVLCLNLRSDREHHHHSPYDLHEYPQPSFNGKPLPETAQGHSTKRRGSRPTNTYEHHRLLSPARPSWPALGKSKRSDQFSPLGDR